MLPIEDIRSNLNHIQERIVRSALESGRDLGEVKLIVVTKTQPAQTIRMAVNAGATIFGENYPEETAIKIPELSDLSGIEWHMIGHLQSRKVKIVAEHFSMLHSLDSIYLAEKLNRALGERNRKMPVLVEVNMGGEASKGGWPGWDQSKWDDILADIEKVALLPNIEIQGLMCMPPLFDDPEASRPFFSSTRKLFEYLRSRGVKGNWIHLSMGTSSDFEIAIQEGATFIRVGTAILGPRHYNKG